VIFTSVLYLAFLALVAVSLALLPSRSRLGFCLVASAVFYATWNPAYLILIFGVGSVGWYFGARAVAAQGRARSTWSWSGIAILIAALVFFRTPALLFAVDAAARRLVGAPPPPPYVAPIPLGLSFYIFEAISYLIECAKGKEQRYGFFEYQLFISFFPHLVAGPIMRAKELVRQFRAPAAFTATRLASGLWYVASGLFLKVVLADQLSPKLDVWFAAPVASLHAPDVVLLALGFGVQMYLDFAGYSRIAIGSARCLGIELVENFNHPFSAVSPPDFWNRWHISLSRWVRDYVFFAVVGRRRNLMRMCQAAIAAMILCGLWHGLGFKFFVWGLFHGLVVAGYHVFRAAREKLFGRPQGTSPMRERVTSFFGWATTLVVLLPGWLLFRAETLGGAARMLRTLVTPRLYAGRAVEGNVYLHVALLFAVVLAAPPVTALLDRALAETRAEWREPLASVSRAVAIGVVSAVTLVYLGTKLSFVYFQF
jgi:alginate O-acetyltransferase complex protein AlgI